MSMKSFSNASSMGKTPSAKSRSPAGRRSKSAWRYVVCSIIAGYIMYCYAFSLPLFAHPLPEYSGPYNVGTIDIETPLSNPRVIDTAQFKDTKEKAFKLETVLFTLYYPAPQNTTSQKPKHRWIPDPVSVTAEGYAKFAHINNVVTNKLFEAALRALVGSIQIPAHVDAPLADLVAAVANDPAVLGDPNANDAELRKVVHVAEHGHPVVVFSHGMASSRTDYTHFAGELASRGYVVALLEHRDGSCPGSVIAQKGAPDRVRLTFRVDEVETGSAGRVRDLTVDEFKRVQLDFRQAEMEEVVRVLRLVNSGRGDEVARLNARGEGEGLAEWKGRLNTADVVVAGHSFGATGAMQALRGGPAADPLRPFKGAVVLDPGKSSGRLNDDVRVPVLVVHSNSWSSANSVFYGRTHFDTVRDVVENNVLRGTPSWFATSLGTSHPSVTDAPLLEPRLLSWTTGARIDVYEGLRQYVHVTEDFLWFLGTGERRGLLREKAEFPEYDGGRGFGVWKPGQGEGGGEDGDGDAGEPGGPWSDWRRYWQVHVSPN
ncbi:PAF acetylhydrolase [Hypoxylon sp. NC1633]|nr:PAF acetylhydrolase [Hypoxylon sp. NC1633]